MYDVRNRNHKLEAIFAKFSETGAACVLASLPYRGRPAYRQAGLEGLYGNLLKTVKRNNTSRKRNNNAAKTNG
jgi:hypothetical protein